GQCGVVGSFHEPESFVRRPARRCRDVDCIAGLFFAVLGELVGTDIETSSSADESDRRAAEIVLQLFEEGLRIGANHARYARVELGQVGMVGRWVGEGRLDLVERVTPFSRRYHGPGNRRELIAPLLDGELV